MANMRPSWPPPSTPIVEPGRMGCERLTRALPARPTRPSRRGRPAASLEAQDATSQGLLSRLDDAGFRFVTDAAPGRSESWRGLHRDGLRAWSNDRLSPAGALTAAARQLGSAGPDSAEVWSELVVRRPALPLGGEDGVERSLALAAALALGSIAWQLWRGTEPVSPLLALQRFSDLDGRVVVGPDRVDVHLPLGRRFLDLERAGLLEEVADVPWLDGRPVRFARG